jgi:RNA polymerase sigma-70 factor (ECF subfamily)
VQLAAAAGLLNAASRWRIVGPHVFGGGDWMTDDRPFDQLMSDLRGGDPVAARQVFDRFARRLAGLAAARLPAAARGRLDPEDVAQSVLRTFFRRQAAGEFTPDHWDALWSLLAVLAARKCGHHVAHLFAGKRDAGREVPLGVGSDSSPTLEPADRSPSPSEVAAFRETLGLVLDGLTERERAVVELRLQGHTVPEVADRVGASERSVHRLLAGVRARLASAAAE